MQMNNIAEDAQTKSGTNTSLPCCKTMCGCDTLAGKVIRFADVEKWRGSVVVGTINPFPVLYYDVTPTPVCEFDTEY
jgi:hypothetical protein